MGIAPTAIIVVFLMNFIQAIEAFQGTLFGISFISIFSSIKIIASMLWGFSFWWLILVAILSAHYLKTKDHSFMFGWWVYTFPLEVFTVAAGLLAGCIATHFLHGMLITLNTLVVIVWVVVVLGTIKWLGSGVFLNPQH
ncbi:MAG: hypothetical protein B5M48_05025 [Candidatus Omnitrophica bacterium 4484_213]|nr:MAG: hypothetical protein B5M48_05025 [Candidatus Omnitrophica bacterium 4484_213]